MTPWLTASDVLTDIEEARWNEHLNAHAERLAEIRRRPPEATYEPPQSNWVPDTPQVRIDIARAIQSGMTQRQAAAEVGWANSTLGRRLQRDPSFRKQVDDAMTVRAARRKKART